MLAPSQPQENAAEDVISFGEWIRRRRSSLRMTQQELANLVSCSAIMIRKIEADARRPSAQIAELLARHLALPTQLAPTFVRAARAELSPQHLPPPHQLQSRTVLDFAPEPPCHLPASPNLLIGRAADLAQLVHLLGQITTRLLTLTGPPGVGKTRLAIQAAWEIRHTFHGGVYMVALAPFAEVSQVVPAITQTLGIRAAAGQPLLTALAHALRRRKRLLLVLDNCEQLDLAPIVSELLAEARELTIIITSRTALRLTAEQRYLVTPLALPPEQRAAPMPARAERIMGRPKAPRPSLVSSAAVELFVARARAVRPDFMLTAANVAAVEGLARRLDGLPLALELAAARVRLFGPQTLLERLAQGTELLKAEMRDLPARQHTLRAAVEWSYLLLTVPQQALFRRLGIFVGGFTLEAAEALADSPPSHVVESLAALIDHSLITSDGERFGMLETLREYALQQLGDAGEVQQTRTRQLHYYAAFAEQAYLELNHHEQARWIRRIIAEQDNLRAVLRWALNGGDQERGLQIAGSIWHFWHHQNSLNEGMYWLSEALMRAPAAPKPLVARALQGAGLLIHLQDDNIRAMELIDRSIGLYRELGDLQGIAFGLLYKVIIERKRGEYRHARTLLQESATLFAQLGDQHGTAWIRFVSGLIAMDQGSRGEAEQLLSEASLLFMASGDQHHAGWMHFNLGQNARFHNNAESAEAHYLTCLQLMEPSTSPGDAPEVAICLGHLARKRGDDRAAVAIYTTSMMRFWDYGDRRHIADCLDGLAVLQGRRGQIAAGIQLMGAAEALREHISVPIAPAERPSYEQSVAILRAQLSDQEFSAAWAVGRALHWEDAIERAIGLFEP